MSYYVLDYKIEKELESLRDVLLKSYSTFLSLTGNTVTSSKLEKISNCIGCLLYNASNKISFGVYRETITLDKASYSKPRILNGKPVKRLVSYRHFRPMLDWMIDTGLIDLKIGGVVSFKADPFSDRAEVNEINSSQIVYRPKLVNLVNEYMGCNNDLVLDNLIHVRNSSGKDLQFKMSGDLKEARKLLESYNSLMAATNFMHRGTGEEFRVQGYKVFNNSSSEYGGRTYLEGGSIQLLNSDDRSQITINGEPTVEYDFCSLHPSLLAEIMGIKLPTGFKPYDIHIEGYDCKLLRKIAKKVLLVMINAKDKTSARKAIENWVNLNRVHLRAEGEIPDIVDVKQIMAVMYERNEVIHRYFCSGAGLELQNKDSKIMDYVLKHFTSCGIPVVPIHDSAIVQEKYDTEMLKVMREAFSVVMGSTLNCNIEKK